MLGLGCHYGHIMFRNLTTNENMLFIMTMKHQNHQTMKIVDVAILVEAKMLIKI
jgi:hypothetical protein